MTQLGSPSLAPAWPLIGREAELAEIEQAITDVACSGVIIGAAAGIGKSRLAREVCAAAERDGALVQWVQGTRSAAAVPLGAVAAILPDEARSDDLLELMRRSAEVMRERAQGRPLILGVDDAQLLDPVSAALVLHLTTRAGVFVLATVRSGERCPDAVVALWKDAGARRLELGRLSDEAVARLVEGALGSPVEAAAIDWLCESSQGNSLYVRELVMGAVDAGALVLKNGLWRLAGRPAISRSLVELVGQRMAGLAAEQRAPIELLALAEPLRLTELVTLTSYNALVEADAHGLLVMDSDQPAGEVRLAHPLFGEVVVGELGALRARMLRLELAAQLQRRTPLAADDALRVARLLLDAGAEIPSALLLEAARGAILAGDAELGAELATRALAETAGLPAALLLARAHTMRNRHEQAEQVLAVAEASAPGHAAAYEYLVLRVRMLFWALRRPADADALLERALAWSEDAAWREQVERHRLIQQMAAGSFVASERSLALLAPPDLESASPTEARLYALALLFGGRAEEAYAVTRRIRPVIPLSDEGDAATLGVHAVSGIESGSDWPDLEVFMGQTFRDAMRAGDHQAAGLAAFALAGILVPAGRFADAQRWCGEAEGQLAFQDSFGTLVNVRALQVGIAAFTGDAAAAAAALERVYPAMPASDPLPTQRPYVLRAQGWAERARAQAAGAKHFLQAAETLVESPGFAAQLAYEALRAGGPAEAALAELAPRCNFRLASAYRAHAAARAARDGTALLAVAEDLAAIGALQYALEAAAEAATVFAREGRQDSARRAATRARELHLPGQGTEAPRIDGVDSRAVELTAREAQLVGLARRGLTNAEIADQLVLSVRTVEAHLYRAMQKLGVSNRREL